ncbi:MAG TPA: MFS transporter [Candidatus Lustribacter sp.]
MKAGRWLLAATILGSSLVIVDGTVVAIALPILQREFHADALSTQWVVEAYMLVLSALMLLSGALGDRYGRKRIFIAGTVLFAIGSILCGFSTSMPFLIAARVLQGLGGTLLAPSSLALIADGFSGAARGKAIGTWSGLTALAGTLGPVLGGVMVDHLGWRSVFFINVPLAIAVLIFGIWGIQNDSRDRHASGPVDLWGSALVTLGLAAIVYAFVGGGVGSFGPRLVAIALAGVAALVLFAWNETRARNPLIAPALFVKRGFFGINLMTLFLYGTMGGVFYFLPFVLISVDGYSATVAGFSSLPFIVAIVVLSRFSGAMVYRVGAKTMLVLGPSVVAAGFACFAILPDTHYWPSIFPSILLVGIGMGLTVAPLTTTLMDSVGERDVGLASGINNAISRVAALLAIAVLGAVLGFTFNASVDRRMDAVRLVPAQRAAINAQRDALAAARLADPAERAIVHAAYLDGFRVAAAGCALLALASGITAAFTQPRKPVRA